MGHDGRVRINVPARNAGELSRIIITTVRKNTVEVVSQEQKLIVIVRPGVNQFAEWWIGGEGNGMALLVDSPQTA